MQGISWSLMGLNDRRGTRGPDATTRKDARICRQVAVPIVRATTRTMRLWEQRSALRSTPCTARNLKRTRLRAMTARDVEDYFTMYLNYPVPQARKLDSPKHVLPRLCELLAESVLAEDSARFVGLRGMPASSPTTALTLRAKQLRPLAIVPSSRDRASTRRSTGHCTWPGTEAQA